MKNTRLGKAQLYVGICTAALAMLAAVLTLAGTVLAQSESVLYSFTGGGDGFSPQSNLVFDAAGNLYGTTTFGATNNCPDSGAGCGVVFEMSPNGSGGWTYGVIHTFAGGTAGGEPPAGLAIDMTGNLYGTTLAGGHSANCVGGCGFVFKLSPNGSGGWIYKVIHEFNATNGANPQAGVVLDSHGTLYGTTYNGGTYGYGVAYKLQPNGGGGWTEEVLHDFSVGADGGWPNSVVVDASGAIYGTTYLGGTQGHCLSFGCGVVFRLVFAGGAWQWKVIHSFLGSGDGGNPSGLTEDGAGNLYVTAASGGNRTCNSYGCGTVYKLSQSGSGWTGAVLHTFSGGSDGSFPYAAPTLDSAGNIYGTTGYGGSASNGTLFELSPSGSSWNEKVLYSFTSGTDGGDPRSGVVLNGLGKIYGETNAGGIPGDCSAYVGCGVVYEVTP